MNAKISQFICSLMDNSLLLAFKKYGLESESVTISIYDFFLFILSFVYFSLDFVHKCIF